MERIYESAAETAKKVRVSLKSAYPGVKFSVRSSTYSGGSSVSVHWTDGPAHEQVDAILNQFESTSFDGMIDLATTHGYMWEGKLYSGADYVTGQRELSAEYRAQVEAYIPSDITVNSWEYHRWFERAEMEMLEVEARALNSTMVSEMIEVADVSDPTPQLVTVTLNTEKSGIEIRFDSKPADGILSMLHENGFRWSRYQGIWWAKQSPERITLANAIVDMLAPSVDEVADTISPVAVETVHDTPASKRTSDKVYVKVWTNDGWSDCFLLPRSYFADGDSAVSDIYDRYSYLHDKSFTYQVGDNDPIEVIDEVNEPAPAQLAEVVSISQYRAKSWHASMTAEQHFKCMLLGEMLGAEEVAKAIAHGTTIDQLFTATAEVMMRMKQM